jgi:hypothetical protein
VNKYIILLTSIALIACVSEKSTGSKLRADDDPSLAIMRTIDDTNTNIGNNAASISTITYTLVM